LPWQRIDLPQSAKTVKPVPAARAQEVLEQKLPDRAAFFTLRMEESSV
jgi:hypothetical protein